MEQRRLGRADLRVSVVGPGCNNFGWKADLAGTRSIIDRTFACGINFLASWALTSAELAEIDQLTIAHATPA